MADPAFRRALDLLAALPGSPYSPNFEGRGSSGVRSAVVGGLLVPALALVVPAGRVHEDGIAAAELRRDVEYLASDSLGGRETGGPGIRRAERYIARAFENAGLTPLPGRSSYWIDFALYRQGFDRARTAIEVGGSRGRLGVDVRPFPFSGEGEVEAPVVFAGYGITAPEYGWDDYTGLDVRGKIVLVLRHEPGERDWQSMFDGAQPSRHSLFEAKIENAAAHGAAAMLLVTDPLNHDADEDLRPSGRLRLEPLEPRAAAGDEPPPLLAAHISRKLAEALVSGGLANLQRAIDAGKPASSLGLASPTARLAVAYSPGAERVEARNVAGFLEGRDPVLKDEWIVVGAHHDHLGAFRGRGDTVFNGADDNASGTSGVLALARAFGRLAERPRRSIAFVTFSAEEKGLLGSRALVEQKLVPVERMVYMLNLDMIGRNPGRDVRVYGDGYVRGLREVVQVANAEPRLPLEFAGDDYGADSDHAPFCEADIPFTFLWTGDHADYHQLGDHADKLDYERMESVVRVAHGIVRAVADLDAAPRFIHDVVWLGAKLEVEDGRAVLTAVEDGSRAAAAGLAAGDVVTALGDEAPPAAEVGRRLDQVEPGQTVALHVARATSGALTIEVARARVGYLGVSLGQLDDDLRASYGLPPEEGILVSQVLPGEPAALAGLENGDVVVSVAGQPVGPGGLTRHLAQIGAGETVELSVVRQGERLTVPVLLGERPSRR